MTLFLRGVIMRALCGAGLALVGGLLLAGAAGGQGGAKKELEAKGWGSLSGKVTFQGPIPQAVVKMAPGGVNIVDETWVVDPKTRGVMNVAVFLKAPRGVYFPVHPRDRKRKGEVVIETPNLAFVPHVAAHYPVYFNGKKYVDTGETFAFKNPSPNVHNPRPIGNPLHNPQFSLTMPPGTEKQIPFLRPQPLPVLVQCDVHPWMNAKLFVFDHPYYALTKKDGTFTIPRVPAGAEVTVMGWHEGVGWLEGREGRKVTFKEGKNEIEFTLNAPK